MKKMFYLVVVGLFFVSLFFASAPVTRGASAIDQLFIKGSSTFSFLGGTDANYQLFRPTKDMIDKVAVEVTEVDPTRDKIEFKIKKWDGASWVLQKQSKQITATDGWNEYNFADFSVTVDGRYAIFVNFYTDGLPHWKYSATGNYDRGYTVSHGVDQVNWDANFKTYGYNATEEPVEEEATVTDNTQSAVSGNTTGASESSSAGTTSTNATNPTTSTAEDDQATDVTTNEPQPSLINAESSNTKTGINYLATYTIAGIDFPIFALCGIGVVIILCILLACLIRRRKKVEKSKRELSQIL